VEIPPDLLEFIEGHIGGNRMSRMKSILLSIIFPSWGRKDSHINYNPKPHFQIANLHA